MYSLSARDHFNSLPSFSHDQHHETDAAKRKGGGVDAITVELLQGDWTRVRDRFVWRICCCQSRCFGARSFFKTIFVGFNLLLMFWSLALSSPLSLDVWRCFLFNWRRVFTKSFVVLIRRRIGWSLMSVDVAGRHYIWLVTGTFRCLSQWCDRV